MRPSRVAKCTNVGAAGRPPGSRLRYIGGDERASPSSQLDIHPRCQPLRAVSGKTTAVAFIDAWSDLRPCMSGVGRDIEGFWT